MIITVSYSVHIKVSQWFHWVPLHLTTFPNPPLFYFICFGLISTVVHCTHICQGWPTPVISPGSGQPIPVYSIAFHHAEHNTPHHSVTPPALQILVTKSPHTFLINHSLVVNNNRLLLSSTLITGQLTLSVVHLDTFSMLSYISFSIHH